MFVHDGKVLRNKLSNNKACPTCLLLIPDLELDLQDSFIP